MDEGVAISDRPITTQADEESQTIIDSDALSLDANEHIEIISAEDERLKIIGRELADDTGRAIFATMCHKRVISPSDLAKTLNISLPLVNWHINRLMSVGLAEIERLGMSQKNKPVKYYGPATTILIIGTEDSEKDSEENKATSPRDNEDALELREKRKNAARKILSRLSKNLTMCIVSFAVGTSVIYLIGNLFARTRSSISVTAGNGGIKLADPDAVSPSIPPPDSFSSLFYGLLPSDALANFVIALIGGVVIGLIVFVAMKMLSRKTRIKA